MKKVVFLVTVALSICSCDKKTDRNWHTPTHEELMAREWVLKDGNEDTVTSFEFLEDGTLRQYLVPTNKNIKGIPWCYTFKYEYDNGAVRVDGDNPNAFTTIRYVIKNDSLIQNSYHIVFFDNDLSQCSTDSSNDTLVAKHPV